MVYVTQVTYASKKLSLQLLLMESPVRNAQPGIIASREPSKRRIALQVSSTKILDRHLPGHASPVLLATTAVVIARIPQNQLGLAHQAISAQQGLQYRIQLQREQATMQRTQQLLVMRKNAIRVFTIHSWPKAHASLAQQATIAKTQG